jgi:hypothetical protein
MMDSEDLFFKEVSQKYAFWKGKASELEKNKKDATKERNYAEAYRLLLNQFSSADAHKPESE